MLPARRAAALGQHRLAEEGGIAVSQRVLIADDLVKAALADDADAQEGRAHAKHR